MRKPLILLLGALLASPALADDWPHWRGPERTGISAETDWSEKGPRILWKAEVGIGYSSFAVADGRVYTLGNSGNRDSVYCFEAETGKKIWSYDYPADLLAKYYKGGPSSTPTIDGGHVYTLGKWGEIFCFEAKTGKIKWARNVQKEHRMPLPTWGFSSSPFIHGDRVILNVGEAGLALDKETGNLVWKSEPEEAAYSTPYPIRRGGTELLVLANAKSYLAVDPKTGKEAWRVRWLTQYGCNAADPLVQGDQVFISSGYEKGAALLKLGTGEPEIVWKNRVMRNQINSSVLIDGYVYGIDGNMSKKPTLKCIELKSGEERWSVANPEPGALMAADGKLIVISTAGELLFAPVSPKAFRPSRKFKALRGECWTVPVLANGRIYCRSSEGHVVCVDVKKR